MNAALLDSQQVESSITDALGSGKLSKCGTGHVEISDGSKDQGKYKAWNWKTVSVSDTKS